MPTRYNYIQFTCLCNLIRSTRMTHRPSDALLYPFLFPLNVLLSTDIIIFCHFIKRKSYKKCRWHNAKLIFSKNVNHMQSLKSLAHTEVFHCICVFLLVTFCLNLLPGMYIIVWLQTLRKVCISSSYGILLMQSPLSRDTTRGMLSFINNFLGQSSFNTRVTASVQKLSIPKEDRKISLEFQTIR